MKGSQKGGKPARHAGVSLHDTTRATASLLLMALAAPGASMAAAAAAAADAGRIAVAQVEPPEATAAASVTATADAGAPPASLPESAPASAPESAPAPPPASTSEATTGAAPAGEITASPSPAPSAPDAPAPGAGVTETPIAPAPVAPPIEAQAPTAAGGDAEPAAQMDEIVVVGIRQSLERAIDIKRDNKQLVDSIVATDIGKLPDNNTVEALQRVTGIQVTGRDRGEANTVTIRGLDDVSTTLDGRQVFTATDRSIALADIPATLLAGVNVFKTRSSDMIEGGVAGQIDVRTQRPFDFKGPKVALAARGIYSDNPDTVDPVLSALFSNRWSTDAGEFGALLNLSYSKLHFRDDLTWAGSLDPYDASSGERIPEFNADGSRAITRGVPLSTAPGSTIPVDGVATPYVLQRDAFGAIQRFGYRERPAANLALQWAPNANQKYLFESFYFGQRGRDTSDQLFVFANGTDRYAPQVLYPNTNVVRQNFLNNVPLYTNTNAARPKTDNLLHALGGEWKLSEDYTLKSEVIYQTTRYDYRSQGINLDATAAQAAIDFNADGHGTPSLGFPGTNLADPTNWRYTWYYDQRSVNRGDAWTWTIDNDYAVDLGPLQKLRYGLRLDTHDAKANNGQQQANCDDVAGCNGALTARPERYTEAPGDFFRGDANYPSTWLVGDYRYLLSNVAASRAMYGFGGRPAYDPAQYFDITEDTYAGYFMGDYGFDLPVGSVDGQAGVRVVRAESDLGYNELQGEDDWQRTQSSSSRTDVLPSFVARYKPTDDVIARFAYGRTIGRPSFANLNPAMTLNPATSTAATFGYAQSGNPDLKPVKADTYDLSLEWYFARSSSLYGTLFYRDVDGFIIDTSRSITVTDRAPELNGNYVLTQPTNAGSGKLKGAEVGFQYFPDRLPSFLRGIGVQSNYTYIDSSSRDPVFDPDDQTRITGYRNSRVTGVSNWAYSVTLAYERDAIGARLSWVDRAKFLTGYNYCCSMPTEVYQNGEASLDFQLNYDVSDSFTVTFDATNLTGEVYRTYYGNRELFNQDSQLYSRTYAAGLRYRF